MTIRVPDGRSPVARKRFYLGGPALVALVYFFGHLYPWARSCFVRSVAAARDVHGSGASPPARLVSLPWCLLLTLDRLNAIAPSAPGSLGVPSPVASPPPDGPSEPGAPD
jgi:hypothetical protein